MTPREWAEKVLREADTMHGPDLFDIERTIVAAIAEARSQTSTIPDIIARTLTALEAVRVAHRHDCPKMRPKRDTVCSEGVLHLGAENSRCDCFGSGTELQLKAIADELRAAIAKERP